MSNNRLNRFLPRNITISLERKTPIVRNVDMERLCATCVLFWDQSCGDSAEHLQSAESTFQYHLQCTQEQVSSHAKTEKC